MYGVYAVGKSSSEKDRIEDNRMNYHHQEVTLKNKRLLLCI